MYENYLVELRNDLELTNEYEGLYKSFGRNDIILILSTLHSSLLNLFKCMNERLPTKGSTAHFWADSSRKLIDLIDKINRLQGELNESEYAFKIEKYNQDIISKCDRFLKKNGGSTIPENMDKIELFYANQIFVKCNTINVKHSIENHRYNLTLLGEGAYALTYKYYDDFYNKYYVVKKAKKGLSEKELKRFKQEFEIMKNLNSPYIIEVHSYNDDENSYIMEYMDYNLGKYLKLNNEKISSKTRRCMVLQLLKACNYLHNKSYLHRDLSPGNILIRVFDDALVVKIADFGLAKNPNNELTTINTEFKGYFNDPNLKLEGFNNYAMPHEIYALTMLIYFITTGRTNTTKITNQNLNDFVKKGLGNQANRYKSVDELRIAYRKYIDS